MNGNKGELSEVYAFLKLLSDGEMQSGDGQLNAIPGKKFPIISVFRDRSPIRFEYHVDAQSHKINIVGPSHSSSRNQSEFDAEAKALLDKIIRLNESPDFTDTERFLDSIGVTKVNAISRDEDDIRLIIHDFRRGITPEMGYSIKSRLGGNSTLVNTCGDGSNFLYEVLNIDNNTMCLFNEEKYFKKKFEILKQNGSTVVFKRVVSSNFNANLTLIDSCLPMIAAQCLLCYYAERKKDLSIVAATLAQRNSLGYDISTQPLMYEYKLKQFLLACALGMTPATIWNTKFNANGGYIVVKEDGDIVCYHFFDRNELEDYLFCHSYFETPSTTKHCFGNIEKASDEKYYLKLNIQVRFK